MLAPLVKREILWRLITGEQGAIVRQLGLADSSLTHIARAVRWIRDHYAQSFRVEDVARLSGMSVSAFYRNFQAVTAMSPIQFQKQIRLQEARLLLATRPNDVTGVGHRVGYDSPSQFSREYRRQFGAPPSQDAARCAPRGARSHRPNFGRACGVIGVNRLTRFPSVNAEDGTHRVRMIRRLTLDRATRSRRGEEPRRAPLGEGAVPRRATNEVRCDTI